jgi:putative spermidine/putrescine transport system permease protein
MKKKKGFEWGYLLLIPGIGYIVYFIAMSTYVMTMQSLGYYNYTGVSEFSLKFWKELFEKGFWDCLLFSLKVGISSSMISIIICYPFALILQKTPGKKTLLSIIKTPMFIPSLVASFLIINIIDYHGIVNEILVWLNFIQEPLRLRNDDYGIGVLVIQVWKNVPFQMIIMFPAIEGIRKDVKDAARNLGAGSLSVLRHIIFPLSLPSALVAVILVFINTFNDFAISNTAGPLYPTSLANLMYKKAYLFNEWNTSACIGVIMMVTTIVFVSIYTAIAKKLEKMN